MFKRALLLAAACAALLAGPAIAQTITAPQVQTVNNNDLFQDDVNGAQTSVVNCTALVLSTALSGSTAGVASAPISCASSAGFGAAGTAAMLFDNGGSGKITVSAEL
jgi:hypothetical protein